MDTVFLLFVPLLFQFVELLQEADFISSWEPITAYEKPEVDISHGLNELPLKVEVQVRVFDSSLGKHIYFLATGSAQRGNDNTQPYGGVLYIYNTQIVKVLAPGPLSCSDEKCSGSIIFLGGTEFLGESDISATSYTTGEVRARIWRACSLPRPDFTSTMLTLYPGNFRTMWFNMRRPPTLVILRVHIDDDWVYEAQGSVFYTRSNDEFGGVIFGISGNTIRIWVPARGSGTSNANGVPFNAMNGWGNSGDFGYSSNVKVRAFAWDFVSLETNPILMSQTYYQSNNYYISAQQGHAFNDDKKLMILMIASEAGTNTGFHFFPTGSSMTDGTLSNGNSNFGSLIFGYTDDKIYYWVPKSTSSGCVVLTGGLWGNNQNSQCLTINDVSLKMTLSSLDDAVLEPVCDDFECIGASNRGAECNCTGSGMEGQYCLTAITCPMPTDQQNADITPFNFIYNYNDGVTSSCKNGYDYVNGSTFRVCQEDKTWSGSPYMCEPVPCGMPENGTFSYIEDLEGTSFQDEALYACVAGYDALSGNDRRVCQADKQWNGIPLICKQSCIEMPLPDGVMRTNTGSFVDDEAQLDCNAGFYYESGNASRQCKEDGSWSGDPYVCARISCGVPPNITLTSLSYSTTLFESVADYTCDSGYADKTSGLTSKSLICNHDGQWHGTRIDCQAVMCLDPPSIQNGLFNSSLSYKYGDVVIYECNFGFRLIGTAERSCQADSSWTSPSPTCEEITCPQFNVSDGEVYMSSNKVTGFATVVCSEYSTLYGSCTPRFCQSNGTWSGNLPRCLNDKSADKTGRQLEDFKSVGFRTRRDTVTTSIHGEFHLYKVNKTETSLYLRSLHSASDDRQSAAIIGWIAVTIMFSIALFTLFLDCIGRESIKEMSRNPKSNSNKT